jgi:hypothetical protein
VHSLHLLKAFLVEPSFRVFNNSEVLPPSTGYQSVQQLWGVFPDTLLSHNSKQSSLVHSLHSLKALLVELTEYSVTLVVLSLHKLSSRVFNNSEAPSEFENFLVCPPGTFSSEFKHNSDAHSLHWLHRVSTLSCTPCTSLKEPRTLKQTHKDREFYLLPAD